MAKRASANFANTDSDTESYYVATNSESEEEYDRRLTKHNCVVPPESMRRKGVRPQSDSDSENEEILTKQYAIANIYEILNDPENGSLSFDTIRDMVKDELIRGSLLYNVFGQALLDDDFSFKNYMDSIADGYTHNESLDYVAEKNKQERNRITKKKQSYSEKSVQDHSEESDQEI
jgi:hypothetical protein